MSFTASGPSTTIVLRGYSGLEYIGLDNVTVLQTSSAIPEPLRTSSAIPEPSTWATMLLGFGGLGFGGYLRSKTNWLAVLAA